ncbi:MAG: type II secretion system F family protein [Porphyrobacter sp.]|nr:type II secretion system F family protein [Porphyrobacter sp.]
MINSAPGPTLLGVDVILVGSILAGVAAAAMLYVIYGVLTVRDPMLKRIKSLNARRDELKSGLTSSSGRKRQSLLRRTETTDRVKDTLAGMKVLQDSQIKAIQQLLAQAGYRNKEYAVFVIFARMILPIVLGFVGVVALYWMDMFPDWSSLKRFLGFAALVICGYKGPETFLKNKAKKRTDEIRKGLPDALDLLVICAEAGLTVDAGFNRVAKELGRAYPELGDEFALTAIELSFLTERRQAFENFAYRVDLDSIKGVVTTMIQTERYGTPLASALRVLSAEFRNERMMRAEEKAARLPAIMTVPLILFILPVLFIAILGPAACDISDAFTGPDAVGSK